MPAMMLLRGIRADPLPGQKAALPPLALALARMHDRNGEAGRALAVLRDTG